MCLLLLFSYNICGRSPWAHLPRTTKNKNKYILKKTLCAIHLSESDHVKRILLRKTQTKCISAPHPSQKIIYSCHLLRTLQCQQQRTCHEVSVSLNCETPTPLRSSTAEGDGRKKRACLQWGIAQWKWITADRWHLNSLRHHRGELEEQAGGKNKKRGHCVKD